MRIWLNGTNEWTDSFMQASWEHFLISLSPFLFLIKHYRRNLSVHRNKDSYENFITNVPFDKLKRALTFPPKWSEAYFLWQPSRTSVKHKLNAEPFPHFDDPPPPCSKLHMHYGKFKWMENSSRKERELSAHLIPSLHSWFEAKLLFNCAALWSRIKPTI